MPVLLTGTPLAGRVAVVSGASSGIGAATARRLAGLGAKVAVLARRKKQLDALVESIQAAGGPALALPVDVTDRDAVHSAARQGAAELGQADLVFNNAGVQLVSPITDLRQDDWQRQIDLNVTGVMNVIAAFLPHPLPRRRRSWARSGSLHGGERMDGWCSAADERSPVLG
ncbi:SDR family oxidoreductase [Nonomuraea sp. NPDC001699]